MTPARPRWRDGAAVSVTARRRPGWKVSIFLHGVRRPVSSMMASAPRWSRVRDRQAKQVYAAGRNVFTEVAGREPVTGFGNF